MIFATSSEIGTPKKIILSIINLEKTSMTATFICLSSIIEGFIYAACIDENLCKERELIPKCFVAYFSNSLAIIKYLNEISYKDRKKPKVEEIYLPGLTVPVTRKLPAATDRRQSSAPLQLPQRYANCSFSANLRWKQAFFLL